MVTTMEKNAIRRRERRRDFITSLCFLSPSLLGVGVFFILPFGVVVYYSLIDGVGSKNFVAFDNFIKLFHNSAFIMAAKNTLSFSVLAVPLAEERLYPHLIAADVLVAAVVLFLPVPHYAWLAFVCVLAPFVPIRHALRMLRRPYMQTLIAVGILFTAMWDSRWKDGRQSERSRAL